MCAILQPHLSLSFMDTNSNKLNITKLFLAKLHFPCPRLFGFFNNISFASLLASNHFLVFLPYV